MPYAIRSIMFAGLLVVGPTVAVAQVDGECGGMAEIDQRISEESDDAFGALQAHARAIGDLQKCNQELHGRVSDLETRLQRLEEQPPREAQ